MSVHIRLNVKLADAGQLRAQALPELEIKTAVADEDSADARAGGAQPPRET